MIQHPVALVEKAKLLPTHGNLQSQDGPVVVRVSPKSLACATTWG